MSCGIGHRHSSDLALLWQWLRPVAIALIRLLAWEPPHALGVALKRPKKKKKKKDSQVSGMSSWVDGDASYKMGTTTKERNYGGKSKSSLEATLGLRHPNGGGRKSDNRHLELRRESTIKT